MAKFKVTFEGGDSVEIVAPDREEAAAHATSVSMRVASSRNAPMKAERVQKVVEVEQVGD